MDILECAYYRIGDSAWAIIIVLLLAGGCQNSAIKEATPEPPVEPVKIAAVEEVSDLSEREDQIEIMDETSVMIILSKYDAIIKKYSGRYGFDWMLISAQVFAESSFKPTVVSYAGAIGLMQIMPGTSRWLGVDPASLIEPETNISLGCYYDKKIYVGIKNVVTEKDKLSFMLASYNCGPSRVTRIRSSVEDGRWEDISNLVPSETQTYVPKIWAKYEDYKRLH